MGLDLITINKKGKNKAQGTAQEHLMSRGLVEEENPTKTLLEDFYFLPFWMMFH